jgi:hypothetical protein
MTDAPNLTPARRDDLIASIAFILSKKGTKRSSLGTVERIVAEKLSDELEHFPITLHRSLRRRDSLRILAA